MESGSGRDGARSDGAVIGDTGGNQWVRQVQQDRPAPAEQDQPLGVDAIGDAARGTGNVGGCVSVGDERRSPAMLPDDTVDVRCPVHRWTAPKRLSKVSAYS